MALIIWDFDDSIVGITKKDSSTNNLINDALKKSGKPANDENIKKVISDLLKDETQVVLKNPEQFVESFRDAKKNGHKVAIASNNHYKEVIEAYLEKAGLTKEEIADTIIDNKLVDKEEREQHGKNKFIERIVRTCEEKYGVKYQPSQIILLDDSATNNKRAREAGYTAIDILGKIDADPKAYIGRITPIIQMDAATTHILPIHNKLLALTGIADIQKAEISVRDSIIAKMKEEGINADSIESTTGFVKLNKALTADEVIKCQNIVNTTITNYIETRTITVETQRFENAFIDIDDEDGTKSINGLFGKVKTILQKQNLLLNPDESKTGLKLICASDAEKLTISGLNKEEMAIMQEALKALGYDNITPNKDTITFDPQLLKQKAQAPAQAPELEVEEEELEADVEKSVKEKLEEEIQLYDMTIESDSKDHKAYYMKAGALVKLAKETGNNSYYEQALKDYNKAIELTESKNPLYLVGRSKLYIDTGKPELAKADIDKIKKLPPHSEEIFAMYIKSTVSEVEEKLGFAPTQPAKAEPAAEKTQYPEARADIKVIPESEKGKKVTELASPKAVEEQAKAAIQPAKAEPAAEKTQYPEAKVDITRSIAEYSRLFNEDGSYNNANIAKYYQNPQNLPVDIQYSIVGGMELELALRQDGNQSTHNKEALDLYSEAIKANPNNPCYLLDRSKVYIRMGQADRAEADMLEAKQLPPTGYKGLDAFARANIEETTQLISELRLRQAEMAKKNTVGVDKKEEQEIKPVKAAESAMPAAPSIAEEQPKVVQGVQQAKVEPVAPAIAEQTIESKGGSTKIATEDPLYFGDKNKLYTNVSELAPAKAAQEQAKPLQTVQPATELAELSTEKLQLPEGKITAPKWQTNKEQKAPKPIQIETSYPQPIPPRDLQRSDQPIAKIETIELKEQPQPKAVEPQIAPSPEKLPRETTATEVAKSHLADIPASSEVDINGLKPMVDLMLAFAKDPKFKATLGNEKVTEFSNKVTEIGESINKNNIDATKGQLQGLVEWCDKESHKPAWQNVINMVGYGIAGAVAKITGNKSTASEYDEKCHQAKDAISGKEFQKALEAVKQAAQKGLEKAAGNNGKQPTNLPQKREGRGV